MLKPILLTTLVSFPLLAQGPAPVWRSYDLAPLAPAGRERVRVEKLLPFLDPEGETQDGELYAAQCYDYVGQLLTSVFEQELSEPGRALRFEQNGAVMLCAPENVHAIFAQLVTQLAHSLRGETDVDVLYASVPTSDAGLLPEAGLVGAADLAGIASRLQGGNGRTLARTTMRVPAEAEGWFAAARDVDALVDYDVEIAQGSHTADPITMNLSAGLRLGVRASGNENGTWIACMSRSTELTGAPTTRRVRVPGRLTGVESVTKRTRNAAGAVTTTNDVEAAGGVLLESDGDYEISQFSAACSAWAVESYVPAGKALVLRSRIALGGADAEGVLVLAPRARAPRSDSIALLNGDQLIVRDVASWSTPRVARIEDLPSTRASGHGFVSPCQGDHALATELRTQPVPEEMFTHEYDGLVSSSNLPGVLFQWQKRNATPPAWPQRAAPRLASVELVLTRGSTRETSARAACVVRTGGTGLVLLGREGLDVRDYDVEVATAASIADPRTSFVFQGLVAEVEPRVAPDGELSVLVRTRARVHRAARAIAELAPNSPATLDFADADLLAGEELLRAGQHGAIDARLGTDIGAGLGVEVRVKLLP